MDKDAGVQNLSGSPFASYQDCVHCHSTPSQIPFPTSNTLLSALILKLLPPSTGETSIQGKGERSQGEDQNSPYTNPVARPHGAMPDAELPSMDS